MEICKHEPCTNIKNGGYGYCKTHSMRHYRGQDMDMESPRNPRPAIIDGDIAKLPLGINAKRGYAIVDKEDAHLSSKKWSLGKRGYPVTGRGVTLHHTIMGKPKEGMVVDHINRDRLDCRKSNLRFVTYKENAQNIGKQSNNTSGYRGVSKIKTSGRWHAMLKVNYQNIHIGNFIDKEEAARAYNKAAKKYFGEFAVLNEVSNE